jgi:hypothetical protein
VNTVIKLRVPENIGKFLSSCTTGSATWSQLVREGCSRVAQTHKTSVTAVNQFGEDRSKFALRPSSVNVNILRQRLQTAGLRALMEMDMFRRIMLLPSSDDVET